MKFFDLHCDTITECLERDQPLAENNLQLSLEAGAGLSPWFQCFAAWIPDTLRGDAAVERFRQIYRRLRREIDKTPGRIMQCVSPGDFARAEREHKTGAVFTVEGGAALGGDLENVGLFSEYGVKAVTLTWNGENEIGSGAMDPSPHGLTAFGREAVRRLEDAGIALDVSHASDPLFYDVAELAHGPIIATHSNSRSLCPHPRNLTDEQFKIIRDSGGLVGLNFYPVFLHGSGAAGKKDILAHAEHFLALGGEDTLAIGSDFDGAAMPEDVSGIGAVPMLAAYFSQHGYPDSLIEKIFYGNARRFFENTLDKN